MHSTYLSFIILFSACSSQKITDSTLMYDVVEDADGDGFHSGEDCDDGNPQIYPGSDEICDGLDNNCDGSIDEDVTLIFYADSDGDGFGNPDIQTDSCSAPDGFVSTGTDCDDTSGLIFPGAPEICDEQDNDCDGAIDNGLGEEYFLDLDDDGFGDETQPIEACALREGISALAGDCDDENTTIHPLADEICDELDNNCDGNIDEGTTTTFYQDFDTDGFGDPLQQLEACVQPAGYVLNTDDCDDIEVLVHPNADEICDELDNNCNGTIDEGSAIDASLWYEDGDEDNFGDPNSSLYACQQPIGYVFLSGDCNDNDENLNPSAVELCNGLDDDCDEEIDEEGAADAPTWYEDGDQDGFGDATQNILSCVQPSNYQSNADDCDDNDNDIYPGATEYCNGEDDNCDGLIDENTAIDATQWYYDLDEDSFGDPAQFQNACDQPINYVANGFDCDDTSDTISPSSVELCNSIDDDCDGDIDEADAIDQVSWYADADADGYGASAYTTLSCNQPTGYVANPSDCNDLDDTINIDASERCDNQDNDCDGDIDEADAIDQVSWYADADADGYGDPANSILSCSAPTGFVGNADDCDDTSDSDLDVDGLQDCADDDIDGDSLSNEWDADPFDDSIVRPPKSGTGALGDVVLSGSLTFEDFTLLDGGAQLSNTVISVVDASIFTEEDEILILSQQGSDAGTYETVFIEEILGNQLRVSPPLQNSYNSQSTVLIQYIPHYDNLTLSGDITAPKWDGTGGGVIMIRILGDADISGSIVVDGLGFRGGNGVYGNGYDPIQGESYLGQGQSGTTQANNGGGGSRPRRGDNSDGGGGGGYGTSGSAGLNAGGSDVTSGGQSYGSTDLSIWFMGSGGGGGSPDTEGDGNSSSNYSGNGGAGGGVISIFAGGSISLSGSLQANGQDGDDSVSGGGELGGGGGGSGGQLYIAAPILDIQGSISHIGGNGGIGNGHAGQYGQAVGGTGGLGRLRLDYDTFIGTLPSNIDHTEGYTE